MPRKNRVHLINQHYTWCGHYVWKGQTYRNWFVTTIRKETTCLACLKRLAMAEALALNEIP